MQGAREDRVKAVKDRATALLAETENCAYSPFVALAEALGLDVGRDGLNAAIGFAGGLSGMGELCGALSAAIAATSAYLSRRSSGSGKFLERHMNVHMATQEVYRRFVAEFGSPYCRVLNPKLDLVSEQQRRKCTHIVRKAVEIALNVIDEAEGRGSA